MRIRRFVLAYYAVLFCGFGLAALIAPESFAKLLDNNLVSDTAKMEFMATYCGLFMGLGFYLFHCLKNNVQQGLITVLFTMGFMLIFRVIAYFVYSADSVIQYIYLVGEFGTVLLVGFLLIKNGKTLKLKVEPI